MTSSSHPARIVVWGLLAHAPFGGMVWQVLHHLIGLRQLGYDVWYVEDTDQRMLNLDITDWVSSGQANANHARRYLEAVGLGGRWIIRSPSPSQVAMTAPDRAKSPKLSPASLNKVSFIYSPRVPARYATPCTSS